MSNNTSIDPNKKNAGGLDKKNAGQRFDHSANTGRKVDNTGNLGGSASKKK